jgi:hypothetical protein
MREKIFEEIDVERRAQDEKWGGADHDDRHGSYDWIAFIARHTGLAVCRPWDPAVFRRQMVRVAALAVAAVEWVDRAGPRVERDVDRVSGEGLLPGSAHEEQP